MIGSEGTETYLLLGLICLCMPAITWIVLAQQRTRAVAFWCLGNLLFAAGLLLARSGGGDPRWQGLSPANLLALAGLLGGVQALREEQGVPWPMAGVGLGVLTWWAAYEALRWTLWPIWTCQGFVTVTWLFIVVWVGAWAWRLTRQRRSPGAMSITVSQGLLALGLTVHLVDLIWGGGHFSQSGHHPLPIGLLGALGALTVLASDVGFIGIVLEKAVLGLVEATDRQARQEERAALGQQLESLDRQRGFGLVAASLAHELNQPLTAILASAQAARRGAAAGRLDPLVCVDLLDKVIRNTRRISVVTERIRGFIRPGELVPGPVDLGKVVQEVLDLLDPDLRRHRVQVVVAGGTLPTLVRGDSVQLSQVVLNVVRNALEAVQGAEVRCIRVALARTGPEATLSVADTGPGLDAGVAGRVGTPFLTTKVQGLGLGLSISSAILRQHQGDLDLRNGEEGGACVVIRLPRLLEGAA